MHWGKAVAKAAAVAAAVVGAGVVGPRHRPHRRPPRDERPAAVSSPATPVATPRDALITRSAANGSSLARAAPPRPRRRSRRAVGLLGSAAASGSTGGAGSGSGSQSPSSPVGNDPVNGGASKLPPRCQDNPLTKTVQAPHQPGSRGRAGQDARRCPRSRCPRSRCPSCPTAASVPDPGGVVERRDGDSQRRRPAPRRGAVNGATGRAAHQHGQRGARDRVTAHCQRYGGRSDRRRRNPGRRLTLPHPTVARSSRR
jgi:hypothetical protein